MAGHERSPKTGAVIRNPYISGNVSRPFRPLSFLFRRFLCSTAPQVQAASPEYHFLWKRLCGQFWVIDSTRAASAQRREVEAGHANWELRGGPHAPGQAPAPSNTREWAHVAL